MACLAVALPANAVETAGGPAMYGRVGKLKAVPGQREALIAALVAGSTAMPGNITYIVARDADDGDGIWIWEQWENADAHRASLALPQVQAAISRGRPLIAAFETGAALSF